MKYVTIPRTDLRVSTICLGSGEVGSSLDQEKSFRLLDAMLEFGGNFLDTAHDYGNWVKGLELSACEKTIGRWMKARGSRQKFVLATKGGDEFLEGPYVPRVNQKDVLTDLEESLRFLQTDVIDLYYLHRDDPAQPVGELLEFLNDQVHAGKIRYYACSNWKTSRMAAAKAYAAEHGLHGFVADESFWNAGVRAKPPYGVSRLGWMNQERYLFHLTSGMAMIPYQSQAFGLYQFMANGTLDQMNPDFRSFYKIPESQQRFERMCRLMDEMHLTITQINLGYLLSQPFLTIPIVGCQTPAQVRDSFSAADVHLSLEQLRFIETGEEPYNIS